MTIESWHDRLGVETVDVVLLDHWKDAYLPDLQVNTDLKCPAIHSFIHPSVVADPIDPYNVPLIYSCWSGKGTWPAARAWWWATTSSSPVRPTSWRT